MNDTPLYRIEGLVVRKESAESGFELVLPELEIARGEVVALVGPSGCGKSSLLDVLAFAAPVATVASFLFRPSAAAAVDVGRALLAADLDALAGLRRRHLGYVLQTGGLLPFLSVEANITLLGRTKGLADIVETLGLSRHLAKKPAALSTGERQRVAIARALAGAPDVILADEPTAALDPRTADLVVELLLTEARRLAAACIVATHEWDRVDQLGLRRLRPRIEAAGRAGWTRSVFLQ